jgi:NADH-quinone oxidoreductase subunit G
MGTVIVNGQEVEVGDHERINGIQAAARAGVEVPHYCWHAGLSVVASCRMCLVETGSKDPETGKITMVPKLVPGCQTPAKDGTVFVTDSPKCQQSRAMVEELLLMDHPIDCPICDKAGECNLQDYHFKYGQKSRRTDIKPFHSRRRSIGPTVTLFVDRCVMCSRCVRFTREVSGTSELMVIQRGQKEEIDVFRDGDGNIARPLDNKLSGNVVDLCPVGALGDKDFLYQQRVWYMQRHKSQCTNCATGCSIEVHENQGTVYRLKPRENMAINQWWMCDEGRYGFHYVNDDERLAAPWQKNDSGFKPVDWSVVFERLHSTLTTAAGSGRLAAIVSPHATVEEAYLLARLVRQHDPEAALALGPVPTIGTDEVFPTGFTISAEKAPNRRGVEKVLAHFGEVVSFDSIVENAADYAFLWVHAGYRPLETEGGAGWIDVETAEKLAKAGTVVISDLFSSPLSDRATWVLPATAFTEKSGSYVNRQGILQSVAWAVRPSAATRSEASVYRQLLGERGLYRAEAVLQELAGEIADFDAVLPGVPPTGVALNADEPATASS